MPRSRTSALLGLLAGFVPLTAIAADLAGRPYDEGYTDPPAFRWQGVYVGAHGGLAFKNFSFPGHTSGMTGGLQGGYNLQLGPAVIGVEVEGSHLGGARRSFLGNEVEQSWRIAGKGRLGLSFDRTLIYATGGYATTRFDALRGAPISDGWKGGYLVGAGIEQGFAGGLSAKLEYNYVSTGELRTALPFGRSAGQDGGHVMKAGLNYRF